MKSKNRAIPRLHKKSGVIKAILVLEFVLRALGAHASQTNPPAIVNVAVHTLRLTCYVVPGSTNQIESSSDVHTWSPYSDPFVVPLTNFVYQDVVVTSTNQYFRIVKGTIRVSPKYYIMAQNLDDLRTQHTAGEIVESYNQLGTVVGKAFTNTRHIYTDPFPFPTFFGQWSQVYIEGHLFTMFYQGGPGNPSLPYYEISGDNSPIAIGDPIFLSLNVPSDFGLVVTPGFSVAPQVTIPVSKPYSGTVGQYITIGGGHYQVVSSLTTNLNSTAAVKLRFGAN